ncbi:MAG: alpha-L-fucosidase [Treponema sp.]|jgi:alpha-L-fucosidase|nr:alpha-L-fucosidase [Treponema sp.]
MATENPAPEVIEEGVHNFSPADRYVPSTDPLIQERLEWFQDQKLALMMHWGPYSQLGLVESWAMSDADADWSRTGVNWTDDGELFKQQYRALNRTFNPLRFQPELWAALAADCGFKYLIFTTKHHDGFCMWDTAYSAYKITSHDCPFHSHSKADITRHLFDAFRAQGLGIAAYFSKADWHTPYYWNPEFPAEKTARGPSYTPAEHPDLWNGFKNFTKNQVLELCRNYGRLDILWFDAGWVRAPKQDIDLGGIVDEARKLQPWLLSADRTVGGPYENYITPEQCIPDKPLGVPWESCVTVGTSFSFAYEDHYKSPRELVHLLSDIVAFGGNLALNIGPQPDGRLPFGAIKSIRELGEWLKKNGQAIYGTRTVAPYKVDNLRYTKKANTVYVIYLCAKGSTLPAIVRLPYAAQVKAVHLLDTGETCAFTRDNDTLSVTLPAAKVGADPLAQVFVLD